MKRLPVTLTLAAWLLAACASAPWEGDAEARRAPPQQPERKEFPGVVESVREVKLDNGRVVAVTQPAGKETLAPGDRVRVLSDGHTARVTR